MSSVLIVYNLIPEELNFFVVPEDQLLPDWEEHLINCHNKTCNGDDYNDSMNWLSSATVSKSEFCSEEVDPKYHCCLYPFKVKLEDNKALVGPFSKVYTSGFFL